MFQNRRGKSVLHDMDFSKLEERLIAHAGIYDSVDIIASMDDMKNLEDMFSKMRQALSKGWMVNLIPVDTYVPPPPRLKNKVYKIIDSFWENPLEGDVYLYLAQLEKNPRTKDVFKGKSTTHHYPWYRRGSKY